MGRVTEYIEYMKDRKILRNERTFKHLTPTQDNDIDRYRYWKDKEQEIKKEKKPKKQKTNFSFKPFKPTLISRVGLTETYQHFTKSFPERNDVEWIGTKKVHEAITKIKWTRNEKE